MKDDASPPEGNKTRQKLTDRHQDDKDVLSVRHNCVSIVSGARTRQKNTFFLFLNQPQNIIVWTRLSENKKKRLEGAQGRAIVKNQRKSWASVGKVCCVIPRRHAPEFVDLYRNNGAAHARARFKRFQHENPTKNLPRCRGSVDPSFFLFWFIAVGKLLEPNLLVHSC